MMEMLVLSSWILHHFDIFAEPDDPKHLKIHFGITLSTEPEVRFVLKRRLGSSQNWNALLASDAIAQNICTCNLCTTLIACFQGK